MAEAATLQTYDGGGNLVALGNGPTTNIVYRTPADIGGNQHAIDFNMNVEWNPNMAIGMDQADLNVDGRVATEMIQSNADTNTYIRTFTANLSPVVDNGNAADVFNAPNGGVVFQRIGNGVQITIVLRKQEAPNEGAVVSRITEFVIPRN